MIIRPPAIEADFQLHKRLCRRGLRVSVAQTIHSEGYLALGLKAQSANYSNTEGSERIEGLARDAECRR